jgi:hypothetical protein
MSDQFAQMWKKAKEDFGGKKPSEKILFWTRKSKVNEAAVGLDKALANIDLANLKPLKTARDAFETAKTSYMKTLEAAMKEKGATELSKSKCQNLAATLSKMEDLFERSSVTCKTEALNIAIVMLTTQGGVPEHDFVADEGRRLLSKKRDLKRDLSRINDETFRAGEISNVPALRKRFLEDKIQFEAIKTRVLPEIKKYCEIFDAKTFKDLPCSPELYAKGSHLSDLHVYYQEFNESDLPTHIAELERATSMLNEKHIKEFDRARQGIGDLVKNRAIAVVLNNLESPINNRAEEVNKEIKICTNGLMRHLNTLKTVAIFIGVDSKPIDSIVANLAKQQSKPFVGDRATGEDVRKRLSAIDKGMSDAIRPFKKFKFPS